MVPRPGGVEHRGPDVRESPTRGATEIAGRRARDRIAPRDHGLETVDGDPRTDQALVPLDAEPDLGVDA